MLFRSKRSRIAQETRDIYAPLAHRLGMAAIRWELEDLAFKFLEPEAYDELAKQVKQKRRERERQVAEMQRPLEEALREAGIPTEVVGRPKHHAMPKSNMYRALHTTVFGPAGAMWARGARWAPSQRAMARGGPGGVA